MRKIISFALAAFLYSSTPAWSAELAAEQQNKLIKSIDADAARMSEIADIVTFGEKEPFNFLFTDPDVELNRWLRLR
jgi:hypothetical protein